jgi:hypothetical protein
MPTSQDIEGAIGALSPEDLDELLLWLDDRYNKCRDPIETRIQAGLAAGRLDNAMRSRLMSAAARTSNLPC